VSLSDSVKYFKHKDRTISCTDRTFHVCTAQCLSLNSQGDNYQEQSLDATWKALIDGQWATGRHCVAMPFNTHSNITQLHIVWSVLCPFTFSPFKLTMTTAAMGRGRGTEAPCHPTPASCPAHGTLFGHVMWSCVMLLCMLDGMATQWRPITDWLSIGAFQVASSDCWGCEVYGL